MSDLLLRPDEMELDVRLRRHGFMIEWCRWGVLSLGRLEEIERIYDNEHAEFERARDAWEAAWEREHALG